MKNGKMIVGIIVVLVLILIIQQKPTEEPGLKLGTQTVIWSAPQYIGESGTVDFTITLTGNTAELTAWTVENIPLPVGWGWSGVEIFSGGSGDNQGYCIPEGGIYNCLATAPPGDQIDTQLIIRYNLPASATNPVSFDSSTFLTTDIAETQNSGVMNTLILTFRQDCGDVDCIGTNDFTGGTWQDCTSNGNDCGVCCICGTSSVNPVATYDETQDGDCSVTTCPSDACGVGGCAVNIFADYPVSVANICSSLKSCTSNICTESCEPDVDGDGYSASCNDCNDALATWNPSIPSSDECNTGDDMNCDTSLTNGITTGGLNQYIDADCDNDYTWLEFKAYLFHWAGVTSNPDFGSVTWTQLKNALLFWATGVTP